MYASPYVLALVGSVAACLLVARYAWLRRPEEPGVRPFVALMGLTVFYAGVYAVALTVHGRGLRQVLEVVQWVGITPIPVAWFAFALSYAGYGSFLTRRRVGALLVVPAVTLALVATNPWHELVWTSSDVVYAAGVVPVQQTFGGWYWVYAAYGYALVGGGSVVLFRVGLGAEQLYADQAAALVVGSVVPLAANAVSIFGRTPLPGLDLTPYAFAVTGVLFGNALFRYRFLDRTPAVRRLGPDSVVAEMDDGVLVLDGGTVVDANPAAERLLARDRDALVGASVASVRETLGLDAIPADETLTVPLDGRTLELQASALTDRHGRAIGRAVVLRDVTDRKRREERIAVLNRVLRHNVRTDASVVLNHLSAVEGSVDDPAAESSVEHVRAATRDLVDTSDKARRLQAAMERVGDPPEYVDLVAVVERVAADVRADHGATVTVDRPEAAVALVSPAVEAAVRDVCENAAEHNDAPDPHVAVSLSVAGGDPSAGVVADTEFTVEVVDDGPGIPEAELAALREGDETPLAHGSGLGLWVVEWVVSGLGGRVTFDEADGGGTAVTISVPVAEVRARTPGRDRERAGEGGATP